MAPIKPGKKLPESWYDFIWNNETPDRMADGSYVKNCLIYCNPTHLYHRRKDDYEKHTGFGVNVMLRGKDLEITNSKFLAKGSCIFLADARYSRIANNTLYSGKGGNNISLQHNIMGIKQAAYIFCPKKRHQNEHL